MRGSVVAAGRGMREGLRDPCFPPSTLVPLPVLPPLLSPISGTEAWVGVDGVGCKDVGRWGWGAIRGMKTPCCSRTCMSAFCPPPSAGTGACGWRGVGCGLTVGISKGMGEGSGAGKGVGFDL